MQYLLARLVRGTCMRSPCWYMRPAVGARARYAGPGQAWARAACALGTPRCLCNGAPGMAAGRRDCTPSPRRLSTCGTCTAALLHRPAFFCTYTHPCSGRRRQSCSARQPPPGPLIGPPRPPRLGDSRRGRRRRRPAAAHPGHADRRRAEPSFSPPPSPGTVPWPAAGLRRRAPHGPPAAATTALDASSRLPCRRGPARPHPPHPPTRHCGRSMGPAMGLGAGERRQAASR